MGRVGWDGDALCDARGRRVRLEPEIAQHTSQTDLIDGALNTRKLLITMSMNQSALPASLVVVIEVIVLRFVRHRQAA